MKLNKRIAATVAAVAIASSTVVGAPSASAEGISIWKATYVDSKNMPEKWKEAFRFGITSAEEAQRCRDAWVDPDPNMPRADVAKYRQCSVYEVTVLDYVLSWLQAIPGLLSAGSSALSSEG